MHDKNKKHSRKYFIAGLAAVLFIAQAALAQVSVDLPGSFAGFSSQDIKKTIENIVRIVLGFIGIIFILLLLYGGFVWMTSQGEADKVNKAKKIIASAVIGLMVTLSAYAIASFIIRSLQEAVSPAGQPGGGACGDGVVDVGELCDQGAFNGTPGFCNLTCNGFVPLIPGCVHPGFGADTVQGTDDDPIRVCYVDNPTNLNQSITINGYNFGNFGDLSEVRINGVVAPIVQCAGVPSWGVTQIVVTVDGATPLGIIADNVVVTRDNDPVNPGGTTTACLAGECGTTNVANGVSPFISCLVPNLGPNGTAVVATGGNFGVAPPPTNSIFMEGALGPFDNAAEVTSWTNDTINFNVPVVTTAITGPVFVRTDIGLATEQTSNPRQFTVTCTVPSGTSAECATGCCSNALQCHLAASCPGAGAGGTPGGPFISAIVPADGEEGNWVTIFGNNFGTNPPNQLHFVWDDGAGFTVDVVDPLPAVCVPGAVWSNTQIIMEVPDIPPVGDSPDSPPAADVYIEAPGGVFSNHVPFSINDTVRPGLCLVNPPNGVFSSPFAVAGINFGGVGAVRDIFFGTPPGISANGQQFIEVLPTPPFDGSGNVPNILAGLTTVALSVDPDAGGPLSAEVSNPLAFTVNPQGAGIPVINEVNPDTGPALQYVTILGSGFGSLPGIARFVEVGNPANFFDGTFDFPAICSTGYWTDSTVITKVPGAAMGDGSYYMRVRNVVSGNWSADFLSPTINDFNKNSALLLGPQLCLVSPAGAPSGFDDVSYFGENFGPPLPPADVLFDSVSAPDNITSGLNAAIDWSSQLIGDVLVPGDAITGTTTVKHSNGISSNPLPFFVGACTSDLQCPAGSECCGDGTCRPLALGGCSGSNYGENNWTFIAGQEPFNLFRQLTCTEGGVQSPTPFPYAHYVDVDNYFLNQGIVVPPYDPASLQTNAPTNVVIAARFTRALNYATAEANITIHQCNTGGPWNFAACGGPIGGGSYAPLGPDGFKWTPPGATLVADTWYEVRLDNGGVASSLVEAQDGSLYLGSEFLGLAPGPDVNDFRWHFRTRTASQAQCDLAQVNVTPVSVLAPIGSPSPLVSAVPVGAQCYICGGVYTYNWRCEPNPPPMPAFPGEFARFEPNDGIPPADGGDGLYCTSDDSLAPVDGDSRYFGYNVSPDRQTPASGPPLNMTATIIDAPNSPINTIAPSLLSVDYVRPRVTRGRPTSACDNVCTNVAPDALFNVNLAPGQPLNTGEVKLMQCTDQTCTAFVGLSVPSTVAFSPAPPPPVNFITITPNAALLTNTHYRVIVSEVIVNTVGQTMDPLYLNYDDPGNGVGALDSYSWTFQTSFEACSPTSIDLVPDPGVINTIGGTLGYFASAQISDPSCGSINLNPNTYDWNWSSALPAVATITNNGECTSDGSVCTVDATCGVGTCEGNPIQFATGLADSGGVPVLIQAFIPNPVPVATGNLFVNDLRDPMVLIGHRPDAPGGTFTPPEIPPPPCPLGGDPYACDLQCMNVLASAIFSTNINSASVVDTLPGGASAYYSFNDGTANESVNGFNGTLTSLGGPNPVPLSPDAALPQIGGGMSFPGPDDFIDVGDVAALNMGITDFTVTGWLKHPDIAGTTRDIINKRIWTPLWSAGYQIQINSWGGNGVLASYFADGVTECPPGSGVICDRIQNQSNVTIDDDAWHHFAVVFDRDALMTIYIDGAPNTTADISPQQGNSVSAFPVLIGGGYGAGGVPVARYDGVLDELRLHPRALLASEINTLYSLGQGIGNSKFYVVDALTNSVIPGSISVKNYSENQGICTGDFSTACTTEVDCQPGNGKCSKNRGRIDFTPNITSSADFTSGLIAYYSFNTGAAKDDTGNGHDGLFIGDAYPTADNTTIPSLGRGLSLDGTGDFVEIADALSELSPPSEMTLSAWVKPVEIPIGSGAPFHTPILTKAGGGWGTFSYDLEGLAWAEIYDDAATGTTLGTTGPALEEGTWEHIAITVDTNNQITAVYRNGISTWFNNPIVDNAFTDLWPAGLGIEQGAGSVRIGGGLAGWRDLKGEMDDVRIYNRALAPTDVFALYNSTMNESIPVGVFPASTPIEIRLCQNNSCATSPILSKQGVPYPNATSAANIWGFTSGDQICKISFVEITPNPAYFVDRQAECTPLSPPQCLDITPKDIFAQAKDSTGLDLGGIDYDWRHTVEYGGGYDSTYYQMQTNLGVLDGSASWSWHEGLLGTDYNEVTARGIDPSLNLGIATAVGKMEFLFCENPWIGELPTTTYYQDIDYDVRLSYCRDSLREGPILPNLPTPHIERESPAPFVADTDLLKEHVFVVGSTQGGPATLFTGGKPIYTISQANVNAQLAPSYEFNDVVILNLTAEDPDGDQFLYVMTSEGGVDVLPGSASFNPQTGSFVWVVDALPQTDSPTDADVINDFELIFTLNPAGAAPDDIRTARINIDTLTPPASVVRPIIQITSACPPVPGSCIANGGTMTVDWGTTVSFVGNADLNGGPPIDTFVWDFQDSGTSTYGGGFPNYTATHSFVQSGNHQVTFRVRNTAHDWSLPAVVNINVLPKLTRVSPATRVAGFTTDEEGKPGLFERLFDSFIGLFISSVSAQPIFDPPSGLVADSVGESTDILLNWEVGAVYDFVRIYRQDPVNPELQIVQLAGSVTTYLDTGPPGVNITPGVNYTYRVCGVIGAQEVCSTIVITARNIDFDVIVARIYKNLNHLSVTEWYRALAPNPVGKPQAIEVDGYPAIRDGTTVYMGIATCVSPSDCNGLIYTNILLLSYNAGATRETVEIFERLLTELQVNPELVWNHLGVQKDAWACSGNPTVFCDEQYDAACTAKNAGLCTSPKAELRRDSRRVGDLHDIAAAVREFAVKNRFCADGTNTIACNTDADCPRDNLGVQLLCTGVYPALTAGTYIGGMSASKWPSWDETLARALDRDSLPKDPINRFGTNFYASAPSSCTEFPGFNPETCWNELDHEFRCHEGSEVYIYKSNGATGFTLLGQAEAFGWSNNWFGIDPDVVLDMNNHAEEVCNAAAALAGVCGNGVIEQDPTIDIDFLVSDITIGGIAIDDVQMGGAVYDPLLGWIEIYDGTTQTYTVDPAGPVNPAFPGLYVERQLVGNLIRLRFALASINHDYEGTLTFKGATVTGIEDYSGGINAGLESLDGNCGNPLQDLLHITSSNTIEFCMQTGAVADNFYVYLSDPREVCDGGSANFCDATFGPDQYNSEFTVGCLADCSGWGNPPGGAALCGGVCGNGVVDPPFEQCDPADPASTALYSCTVGGNVFCSDLCKISCTQGSPYTGGSCGDGVVQLPEACDEGGLNGTVGHCNATCSGYVSYCGDGAVTPTDEFPLGCTCDNVVSCGPSVTYAPLMGAFCVKTCDLPTILAHQWTCVANAEECDGVSGLTSYSCPLGTNLYCDGACVRACTEVRIDASGNREVVPIYEHYLENGLTSDYDYTQYKKSDTGYTTKGIAFYLDEYDGACLTPVSTRHFYSSATGDHRLATAGVPAGYAWDPIDYIGCAYSADQDPATNVCSNNPGNPAGCADDDDCTGGGRCIFGGISVPVYEFRNAADEYYYSRNATPRTGGQNDPYIMQGGGPLMYAWLGPFQESCGNDAVEGTEECEPGQYQTPTTNQSSQSVQYACGEPLTPNACRVYGGWCGDATKNPPFEACDEGSYTCSGSGAVCTTDADCGGGTCGGRCDTNAAIVCATDVNCPPGAGNVPGKCMGNGAPCNNNSANCTYCTASCGSALLPRNFCGDGIVNCGINTPANCSDADPYTEVCDDGVANNGNPGSCNETCTGITGAVCGDGNIVRQCNTDTNIACSMSCAGGANNGNPCVNGEQCPGGACSVATPAGGPCPVDPMGGTVGSCAGEVCDDGTLNGNWTYSCDFDSWTACTLDAAGDQICDMTNDGADDDDAVCTSANPRAYCSFACQGGTTPVCGDEIVQSYCINNPQTACSVDPDCPAGDTCRVELCDFGSLNGEVGSCNSTCTGFTSAVCGDSTISVGLCSGSLAVCGGPVGINPPCPPGETCVNGETCDPNTARAVLNCLDGGRPGLVATECLACQLLTTQCHAYGLKVWSDAVDVAYINSYLVTDSIAPPGQCSADPDYHGDDYNLVDSPASGNACAPPIDQVPWHIWSTNPTDVRPDFQDWEVNGLNVVAIKVWPSNPAGADCASGGCRSFQAVYTSPTLRNLFVTTPGQLSDWACSNTYIPGWNFAECPDALGLCSNGVTPCSSIAPCPGGLVCGPDGFSDCDPNVAANTWRHPVSYTNSSDLINHALCRFNYTDFIGGAARWVWGPQCTADVVYCRLEYNTSAAVGSAWNPNFGWIRIVTGGSEVTVRLSDKRCSEDSSVQCVNSIDCVSAGLGTCNYRLDGAAWNRNLGWLHFDGVAASEDGTSNPQAGKPATVHPATGKFSGFAWGKNYGLVTMDPRATCDISSNCSTGFGGRFYTSVTWNSGSGIADGYAWSEKAGWIDFGPFNASTVTLKQLP